jgi:hypothetical protein
VAATRSVAVLHATEPASVHLAILARTEGVTVADVDAALYDRREIVKQLAMRRTLFVFPRDLLPAAWGSASRRVAERETARLAKDVIAHGIADDGEAWVARATSAVRDLLGDGTARSAQQVREALPDLDGRMRVAPGKKYEANVSIVPRVLTVLGARSEIVRGRNAGNWRVSRPMWTTMDGWLGAPRRPLDSPAGYAELVERWLARFGPGTEDDLVWWLGATKGVVRQALDDVGAVEVELDDGLPTGYVLPGDEEPEPPVEPWAALLPVLDPTTMGWRHRRFYLDPAHVPYLFDTAGNGGTTAWWDGRIVGCWVQDDDGAVRVILREDVGADGRAALDAEAARLTALLGGERVSSVFASPQMRGERLR